MIPDSAGAAINDIAKDTDWKASLAKVVRDPGELLRILELDHIPGLLLAARSAAMQFPLRVPLSFLSRIRCGDLNDPLLRQVLPLADELKNVAGFSADAVGEIPAMVRPGLIHKYDGRALLITSGTCAIHCRYCFRREFPYADADPKPDFWQSTLDYIKKNPDISEIILSGGDPLTLTDNSLAKLFDQIAGIPHLKRIRIHSRLAVVLPERITHSLCELFNSSNLQIIHVIHTNHAQEIDEHVIKAIQRLRSAGHLVYNQAVLLKNVNDSVEALKDLSEKLIEIGVQPYYLHLLDRVKGAHHYEVDEKTAKSLVHDLSKIVPGYMLPRLVREIVGEHAKTPIQLDV